MPADMERHNTLWGHRRRRGLPNPWRAVQRNLSQRRRTSDLEEQQRSRLQLDAKRAWPIPYRNQRNRADLRRLVIHIQSADRLRSLYPATRQRTEISGPEQHQPARRPKRERRFQPRGATVQYRRLWGRESPRLRNVDGGPARLAHPGWP